jgi:hypothetical protein
MCTNSSLMHVPHVLKQSTQVGHLSPSETPTPRNLELAICHPAWQPQLLNIAMLKIDMQKIVVTLKYRKTPNMFETTRRPLPNIVCLDSKNKHC